jgi:hypothetical protein
MPAVTFIDAIPNHISVEEHRTLTGATPASFSDIPPVLRQKVDNLRVAFDPPLDGFSPEDGVLGTLYIIERFLLSHPLPCISCCFCFTDSDQPLQCPRIPVLYGTRLPDRVPVHNAARHVARGLWPFRLLPT